MHCFLLAAQVSVGGVVVDPDGAAVPNIRIHLNTPLGAAVEGANAVADSAGRFRFQHVAPGDYTLEVPATYSQLLCQRLATILKSQTHFCVIGQDRHGSKKISI